MDLLDPLKKAFENLPIMEIPDAMLINQTVLMPIAIQKMQSAWYQYKERVVLAGPINCSIEDFEMQLRSLKHIVSEGIVGCKAKLASL